ncbi:MAG: vWA domain-containing protein [Spirochaetota bacterium]
MRRRRSGSRTLLLATAALLAAALAAGGLARPPALLAQEASGAGAGPAADRAPDISWPTEPYERPDEPATASRSGAPAERATGPATPDASAATGPRTADATRDRANAGPLAVIPADVRIEQTIEGGYYLYVRKGDIASVLITESTEAPDHQVATYAFRNPAYHPENGDERRILDGEFLDAEGVYSLLDSTPVPDEEFGEAYRVFIPYVVVYGYDWTRHGQLQVLDGTYMSIRAFEKPYADYSGAYRDNPFILRVVQRPSITERPEYMPEAVERLREIARENGGDSVESVDDEDVVETIERLIAESQGRTLDLVLALDTTQSMEDNVPYLQQHLVPMLSNYTAGKDSLRVGLVYYRDYMEEYLTRRVDFQSELDYVQRAVDTIRVAGGRDIPEAVYEALYTALLRFPWQADDRLVVLVGDAPPHPRPRGAITRELVQSEARRLGVTIHTIILPQ